MQKHGKALDDKVLFWENMGKHWVNTGKHKKPLGKRTKMQKDMGKRRSIFEKQWENMGKHRKNPKKRKNRMTKFNIGKTRENIRKTLGKHGKTWENTGKHGKTWENTVNTFSITLWTLSGKLKSSSASLSGTYTLSSSSNSLRASLTFCCKLLYTVR
jgi:hypothetical protein